MHRPRPGIAGVSENIRVTSIVGRFLEHTRIFYFHNNGDTKILLGSADLMRRNLNRRVEQLFPVADPALKEMLYTQILCTHLADNVKARRLLPDGSYERLTPADGQPAVNSQQWMIDHRGSWSTEIA
jgi:polyphosphate kinase